MSAFEILRVLRISALTLSLWMIGAANAQSAQDKYYRAYYLETSAADFAAAGKLYAEVVADRGLDEAVRTDAQRRLAGCEEQVSASDPARLMPMDAIAYVELNRPGEQIGLLLDQLGLLSTAQESLKQAGPRVAISPALIKELLGLRSVAVAVTGIDPNHGMPTGVAIVNPGNLDVLRELLISALPTSAKQVQPIGGFSTYAIEDHAFITITHRLIVAGTQRDQIEDVLERLKNGRADSLLTNPAIAAELATRTDALLFFCVNAKPILPLLNGALAAGAGQSRDAALAQAMFDPNSLETFSGRAGVRADGLFIDVNLRLNESHRNRVFNLLRNAPIDPATLKQIPSGAAAFVAGAFNPVNSSYSAGPADQAAVVSALDFGREIFANIVGFAAFVLPPDGTGTAGGMPIPQAALVFTVHDPVKSQALWSEVLGLASVANGSGTVDGTPGQIDGQDVRTFAMPQGIGISLAVIGNDVVITPSDTALRRVLAVKRGASNILQDESFASSVGRIDASSTLAAFVHAGRCAEIGKMYMSPGDVAEMSQFTDTMSRTVASLVISQSSQQLSFSARVSGVPKIGGAIAKVLAENRTMAEREGLLDQAIRGRDWKTAAAMLDKRLAEHPNDAEALFHRVTLALASGDDGPTGIALADRLFELKKNDANWLNNKAWDLLMDDQCNPSSGALALRLAVRSNELTRYEDWRFVDTLAWAYFKTGDRAKAIETGRKALELVGEDGRRREVVKSLTKFEANADEPQSGSNSGTR